MYFLLNTVGSSDIIIDSDDSDTEENELNIATIEDPDVSSTSVDEMWTYVFIRIFLSCCLDITKIYIMPYRLSYQDEINEKWVLK